MDFLNSIREFFRENPRAWVVVAVGVVAAGIVVLGVYGGFGVQIGRFFAAETPTEGACEVPQEQWHCETGDCDGDGYPNPAGSTRSSNDACNDPNDGNRCITGSLSLSECQQAATPTPTATPTPPPPPPPPEQTPTPAPSAPPVNGGTCASSGSRLTPATMGGQCGTTQNVVTWTNPITPTETRNNLFRNGYDASGNLLSTAVVFTEVGCWDGSGGGTFVDKNIPPLPSGSVYWYVMKTSGSPNVWSANALKCSAPSSGAAAPTSTPPPSTTSTPPPSTTQTPTPTPVSAVVCQPATQTADPDQWVTLQAIGGDGKYQWEVTGGGIVQAGGDEMITISYHVPGLKHVRVSSAGSAAVCTVDVLFPSPSPTQQAAGALSIEKLARNMSTGQVSPVDSLAITPNTVAQFVINVKSNSSQPLGNIVLRDTVPRGMSYQQGSTYVQGQLIVVDTITTSGLPLGTLAAGDSFTVRWSAIADRTDLVAVGVQELHPLAVITADGAQAADDVTLQVQGTGTLTGGGAGPGSVQTGPGDVLLLALAAAAGLTLAYTGYTRSNAFHRKEAERMSREQGPLDFRS